MLYVLFILCVNEFDNEFFLYILYKIIYIIINNMEFNDMIVYVLINNGKGINDFKKQNKMVLINVCLVLFYMYR